MAFPAPMIQIGVKYLIGLIEEKNHLVLRAALTHESILSIIKRIYSEEYDVREN